MPKMETPGPMILMDAPDDECCEERGWVETTVGQNEARALLAPFCCNEDGDRGARPVGLAVRVHLRPNIEGRDPEWIGCPADDPDAVEFFEFDTTDATASDV